MNLEDTVKDCAALAHLHPRYIFFAERHAEYIEIMSADVTSAHSLEINDRCSIALQHFLYPAKLLERKSSRNDYSISQGRPRWSGEGRIHGAGRGHSKRADNPDHFRPVAFASQNA